MFPFSALIINLILNKAELGATLLLYIIINMSTLPNDIWHIVSQKLKPSELFSFLLTHRHAKDAVSQSQINDMKIWGPVLKEYDKIFKDYAWLMRLEPLDLTPILIYRNKKRSYIDIWLADRVQTGVLNRDGSISYSRQFGGGRLENYEDVQKERHIIFDMILRSLHFQKSGQRHYQIQFPKFTVDLSGVVTLSG